MRLGVVAPIFALLLFACPCLAAEDISVVPTEQLVDRLAELDDQTAGISDGGMYGTFMAVDEPVRFEMGLLPARDLHVPPVMRELVRRGADALPILIAHLGDARPTKIVVGDTSRSSFPMQAFTDEYIPRDGETFDEGCTAHLSGGPDGCRGFEGGYTIKIGDVCEVLIGQIVNRPLTAAHYQPTALFFVNSPIEMPRLKTRIVKDWSGVDAKALEASLLRDLRGNWDIRSDAALKRLRFYFPKTYAGLTGADAERRKAFEARERADR
jgi:hypothetical protein